jgi:hypothetical protein
MVDGADQELSEERSLRAASRVSLGSVKEAKFNVIGMALPLAGLKLPSETKVWNNGTHRPRERGNGCGGTTAMRIDQK